VIIFLNNNKISSRISSALLVRFNRVYRTNQLKPACRFEYINVPTAQRLLFRHAFFAQRSLVLAEIRAK